MRVVAIVQARMTSSRLPGKVMLPLGDKTVLGHVLTRCKEIAGVTEVCCAIPIGNEHDILIEETRKYGCTVFRGSEDNVLERYHDAAKHVKADVVMRVTSDCPLISPSVCAQVLDLHLKNGSEYTCNNMPVSWPHGYDCEVFNFSALASTVSKAESQEDKEHVTPWMRRNLAVANLSNPKGNQYHHRITLDTPEDYANIVKIFTQKELFFDNVCHKKVAFFRFEASTNIGAGHAIRSGVLADALARRGWECVCITQAESLEFIKDLNRFKSIEPSVFESGQLSCDLLVIDHYGLDADYETKMRRFAKQIWVIDDLANRHHDCDLLLDQTYGREAKAYKNLVPDQCKILTGSDYVLLRQDFIKLRPKALEKRNKTKEIERILVCMGGSDPKNYTQKALEMIEASDFKGVIDVVLGFSAEKKSTIENYSKNLVNQCFFYHNAKMPSLIFKADLAIGASGSGLWERYCLGLPSVLMTTADNQAAIYSALQASGKIHTLQECLDNDTSNLYAAVSNIIDGFGVNRVLMAGFMPDTERKITLKKVTNQDKDLIFAWQSLTAVRQYARHPELPTYQEHEQWFEQRLKRVSDPYWLICENGNPVGALSLAHDMRQSAYELSWYLEPSVQGRGIGTEAVKLAAEIVDPFEIIAFVKTENIASHRSLQKAGFSSLDAQHYKMERH